MIKSCPYCDEEDIDMDETECPNCGRELEVYLTCPECGEILDEDDIHWACPFCNGEGEGYLICPNCEALATTNGEEWICEYCDNDYNISSNMNIA